MSYIPARGALVCEPPPFRFREGVVKKKKFTKLKEKGEARRGNKSSNSGYARLGEYGVVDQEISGIRWVARWSGSIAQLLLAVVINGQAYVCRCDERAG